MADRLQSYRNLVTDRQDAWKSRVGIPYLLQYDLAYKSYQDTVAAQKDADEDRGELFVTAASLVIGSTLLATVASASMRKLLRRSVVKYARQNLDLTMIRTINRTRHNLSVGFAIGKIFDEVKDGVTKQFQEIATRWSQANVDFVTATPLSQTLQVEQILINNRLCAFEFADAIEADRQMTTAAKDAAFTSLRRAPLHKDPKLGLPMARERWRKRLNLAFT